MKMMTTQALLMFSFILRYELRVIALYINYFGYASNLNPSVLKRRIQTQTPSIVPKKEDEIIPIRCVLPRYKLVFNLGQNVGSYYASVEPCSDSGSFDAVHGLLYILTMEQFEQLARTERGYFIEKVFVRYYEPFSDDKRSGTWNDACMDLEGVEMNPNMGCMALTFRSGMGLYSTGQPSSRYLRLIRQGAKDQRLHSSYLKYLDGIEPYKRSGR